MPPSIRQSVLARKYVRAHVTAVLLDANVDPTTDPVKMAFTAVGVDPAAGDWQAAIWETVGTTYYALCLVGPGGTIALGTGRYRVMVKATDNPEIPAEDAGTLTIY